MTALGACRTHGWLFPAVEFEDEAHLLLIKPVSVSDLGDIATRLAALN